MEWLFLTYNDIEAPLSTAFVLTVREPEATRVPAVAPWCQRRFAEAARVLDRHLAGRATLLDEGFGIGDITLGGILSWAHDDGALTSFPAWTPTAVSCWTGSRPSACTPTTSRPEPTCASLPAHEKLTKWQPSPTPCR